MASITRLGPNDLAAFRAMNALFGAVFEEPDTFGHAPPSDDHARDLLSDPRILALVAQDGGTVVGGLVAYELRKLEQRRSELYIYDLAVAESHRRRGIATALIEATRSHARQIGAWVVYVQADPPDVPAVALYDKLGTREEVYHFDIAP